MPSACETRPGSSTSSVTPASSSSLASNALEGGPPCDSPLLVTPTTSSASPSPTALTPRAASASTCSNASVTTCLKSSPTSKARASPTATSSPTTWAYAPAAPTAVASGPVRLLARPHAGHEPRCRHAGLSRPVPRRACQPALGPCGGALRGGRHPLRDGHRDPPGLGGRAGRPAAPRGRHATRRPRAVRPVDTRPAHRLLLARPAPPSRGPIRLRRPDAPGVADRVRGCGPAHHDERLRTARRGRARPSGRRRHVRLARRRARPVRRRHQRPGTARPRHGPPAARIPHHRVEPGGRRRPAGATRGSRRHHPPAGPPRP